jgi:hypothetical protein
MDYKLTRFGEAPFISRFGRLLVGPKTAPAHSGGARRLTRDQAELILRAASLFRTLAPRTQVQTAEAQFKGLPRALMELGGRITKGCFGSDTA